MEKVSSSTQERWNAYQTMVSPERLKSSWKMGSLLEELQVLMSMNFLPWHWEEFLAETKILF